MFRTEFIGRVTGSFYVTLSERVCTICKLLFCINRRVAGELLNISIMILILLQKYGQIVFSHQFMSFYFVQVAICVGGFVSSTPIKNRVFSLRDQSLLSKITVETMRSYHAKLQILTLSMYLLVQSASLVGIPFLNSLYQLLSIHPEAAQSQ